jgi:DNA repair exonuclease SbcCD ATPase subunit
MNEEDKVIQEVAPTSDATPVTGSPASEAPEIQAAQGTHTPEAPTNKEPSESFRYIREQLEKERQERDALQRRNMELEYLARSQQRQQTLVSEPEESLDVNLPGEYDSIEAKHLAEMERKNKLRWSREVEKREQLEMELRRLDADNRLMAEVPNYRELLTPANIRRLEEEMPALAKTIAKDTDPYQVRRATIDAIQRLVSTDNKIKEKEAELKAQTDKINRNLEKPLPSAGGIGANSTSPLSKANAFSGGLTQEAKNEIWNGWNRKMGNNFISGK